MVQVWDNTRIWTLFLEAAMKVRSAQELMKDNLLVRHLGGSHAYGTSLPTSDVDYRGIFCADPVNVRTPFFPVREAEVQDEEDTKYYELAHFMKLCLDCNPNIVETLWVDDEDIVVRTPAYDLLRENREALLSSKVAFTFSGYALAQLKRIKGHNKWLTQANRGVAKLQEAYNSGVVDEDWLHKHFEEDIVNKVITRG